MIIIDKRNMRFLLAGRVLTVSAASPGRYRKGRSYSVGVRHNKEVCRAEILHVDPDAGTVRIRQQILQAEPNLLARYSQYGYTSNPSQAMFGEPEAVEPGDIERVTRAAREHREAQTPLAERLQELERRANDGDRQAKRHLFVIQQRLQVAGNYAGTIAC